MAQKKSKVIPTAAAPLSKPSDGIVGLFHAGVLWDGVDHRMFHGLPMQFELMSGSQGKFSVVSDIDVRDGDEDYWKLVDQLGKQHIRLTKLFDEKLQRLNVKKGRQAADFRRLYKLGELRRLDSLRLIAEKDMMDHFNARYGGDRRIIHKVLGFGPVTLPATLMYQDDDTGSELLIRHINNLSNAEATIARVYFSKYVWSALCRLFKLDAYAPLVWMYMNSVSLGLQKEGGASVEGTQLLIARLLDRINMSPYEFANLDISGYMAAIMMLFAGYSLSANTLTPENWIQSFPIQILHSFTPANAVEHYNGQVDLLAKSGWKREGGSIGITSCPFANSDTIGQPGLYPLTISSSPDRTQHVSIPLDFGGENMLQDGTAIPSIPAEFDRMFGWMHDPQAEGVMLDVRSILPWKLLAAPPADKLYSPIDFWNLYFYSVQSTGVSMTDEEFHPLQWFVGFDSLLPGNSYPLSVNGDTTINTFRMTGRGAKRSRSDYLLSWLSDRSFSMIREAVTK